MAQNSSEKGFPAIRLAVAAEEDTPARLVQRKLVELFDRMRQRHAFEVGQLVKWKAGLKNRKFADYGEPAIVTAILPIPIFDPGEGSAGSPYFQEPLDFVVGIYRDEEYLEYRVDGRRFQPIED